MEAEGIKAVREGFSMISEAAKVVRLSSAISDRDMRMDELEKSC